MHTLLALVSLVLVIVSCSLLLSQLRLIRNWSLRRAVQCFILALPLLMPGLGFGIVHHLIDRFCDFATPLWDLLLGGVLTLGMGIVLFGAICLGLLRLFLLTQVTAHQRSFAPHHTLQRLTERLAQQRGVRSPRVCLCSSDRPLAQTTGIVRPTIVLSTWMLEHLDSREVEAVLAHELEHVAHRDVLLILLATIMRDAFFYLPTSRTVYRQIQHEKEVICDDLAVRLTRRPLALASALTKIWVHSMEHPHLGGSALAQPLTGIGEEVRLRIERLLASPGAPSAHQRKGRFSKGNVFVLITLLMVQGINLIILGAMLACDPAMMLGKFW